MRWPRRSRRGGVDHSNAGPLGGYTPGTWAQAAQPGPQSVVLPPPESTVTVVALPPPVFVHPPPAAAAPPPFVQPRLVAIPPEPAPAASPPVPMPAVSMPAEPMTVPAPPPPPAAPPAATPEPAGVRLGFADGSAVVLDPADPRAAALRAVADVLVSKQPPTRRGWSRKAKR